MIWNVPNILTVFRLGVIPLFITVFYLPGWLGHIGSATLFLLAAVTDWLDGYWARRYGQTSAFGAFLDPVADKLMVTTALVLLTAQEGVPALLTIIIVGREITISALREWMAELGERAAVAVSWMGKFKTGAQMVAIFALLLHTPIYGVDTYFWGLLLLTLAALLTLWSMILYIWVAFPSLGREPSALNPERASQKGGSKGVGG